MIFSQTCRNDAYLLQKNISYEVIDDQSGSSKPVEWRYDSTGTYDARYYYTYDGNGNIVSETLDGKRTTYVYDSANQLIRENNQRANRTWTWTYDAAGNIQNKKEYTYTTGTLGNPLDVVTYTYGNGTWGDLLTVYGGVALTYDDIGNLISYGPRSYTWTQGRQLASMSNGSTTWTYAYDAEGMRTQRTNGTTTYTYVYSGSQLSRMLFGSTTMVFTYDANGRPLAVKYGGVMYYYALNLQGDVVAILDSTGAPVVYYTYDAWGKLLSTTGSLASTLGTWNPLRYRGYVYDQETGLYYLQSRYYNPDWGRFINADALVSTGQGLLGNNMFAYCNNNPANCHDPSGMATFWTSTGDVNPLLSGYYGFGGGGGVTCYRDLGAPIADFFNQAGKIINNTSEQKVLADLQSKRISVYKGTPVLRADWMEGAALSFGIIIMGGDNLYNINFSQTLNHEYGHIIHFAIVGPVDYFNTTAIPSLIGAGISGNDTVIERFVQDNYHSLPWERTANYLGGVGWGNSSASNFGATWFFLWSLLAASTTP